MSQSNFFRKYLDILNEQAPMPTNPKGVPTLPNKPIDFDAVGRNVMGKAGNYVIGQVASLGPDFRKTHQDLTPGSPYYQKNIANNPALVKQAADATSQMTPDQFDASVADTKQRFNQAMDPKQMPTGVSERNPELDKFLNGEPNTPVQEDELEEIKKLAGTEQVDEEKPGLWANIHAKRERIKHGSGERMRKPGSKGAPTADALRKSAK